MPETQTTAQTDVQSSVHSAAPAPPPLLFSLALGLPVFAVLAYLILTLSANRAKRLEAMRAQEEEDRTRQAGENIE